MEERPVRRQLIKVGLIKPQETEVTSKKFRAPPRRPTPKEKAFIYAQLAAHLTEVEGGCRYTDGQSDHTVLAAANAKFSAEEDGEFIPIPLSSVQYIRNEVYGPLAAPPRVADIDSTKLARLERVVRHLVNTSPTLTADDRYELDKILDGNPSF